ncbi:MAG TPA: hypothetical protein VK488_13075 [Gaiellaceae bacterium]|nr:hypothetical protein [Gaiellaceae bacterium]
MATPSKLPLIACSLNADGQQARLIEWAELLGKAMASEPRRGGVQYSFAASDQLEKQIRDLAAAEQSCCSFLEFDISHIGDQIEMTVTAPPHGLEALHFIFST